MTKYVKIVSVLMLLLSSQICFAQGIIMRPQIMKSAPAPSKKGKTVSQSADALCDKGYDAYNKKKYELAVSYYTQAATKGSDIAMCNLALCYWDGLGVPQSKSDALSWWRKAGEKNNAQANYNLAYCYYAGDGVDVNYNKAFEYAKKSELRGYVPSYYLLAMMYYEGRGVKQSDSDAFEWFKLAAESDHMWAKIRLSKMYSSGTGVEKNSQKAYELAVSAAEQGSGYACAMVADFHYFGNLGTVDYKESVKWLNRGVSLGDDTCMYNLGYAYIKGQGIDKDEIKGLDLYQQAARKGNTDAQEALTKRKLTW